MGGDSGAVDAKPETAKHSADGGAGRRLGPGRLAVVGAVLALIPLCVAAGFWQLDRAAQKERHVARMQSRAELPRVVITGDDRWPATVMHRNATARGHTEPEHGVRVRRRGADGTSGFELFEPLRLESSETRLLVDRGWFADGSEALRHPDASTPTEVQGVIAAPVLPPLRLGGYADFGAMDYWPWLDPAAFARLHGYPVMPFILVTDPVRIAQLREAGRGDSGMHLGYAIQWFAFAGMALLLALLMMAPRFGAGR